MKKTTVAQRHLLSSPEGAKENNSQPPKTVPHLEKHSTVFPSNKTKESPKPMTTNKPTPKGRPITLAIIMLLAFALFMIIKMYIHNDKGHRAYAQQIACAAHLKQLGLAFHLYQNDHNASPPTLDALTSTDPLKSLPDCPTAIIQQLPQPHYTYRAADLPLNPPAQLILAHDRYPIHTADRLNTLFADGQVKPLTQEEFNTAIQKDNQARTQLNLPTKPANITLPQ